MGGRRVPVPLSQRKKDYFFIVCFTTFLVISWMVDIISAIGEVGRDGVPGIRRDNTQNALWPPQFMYNAYLDWCDRCDPVFCYNPVWMKVLAGVSPFIYAPFYVFAIYAFVKGKEWIREPCLMYAWGLLFTMTVIMAEEYMGEKASHNFLIVFAGNATYWLFPIPLVLRMWGKHPFSKEKVA
jgi:hypothetical protein